MPVASRASPVARVAPDPLASASADPRDRGSGIFCVRGNRVRVVVFQGGNQEIGILVGTLKGRIVKR